MDTELLNFLFKNSLINCMINFTLLPPNKRIKQIYNSSKETKIRGDKFSIKERFLGISLAYCKQYTKSCYVKTYGKS